MDDGQALTTQRPDKQTFEMMDRFDVQLDRFMRIISMTESLLEPALLGSEPRPERAPEEAPMNQLHSYIIRLEHLNNSFEDLRSRIRL